MQRTVFALSRAGSFGLSARHARRFFHGSAPRLAGQGIVDEHSYKFNNEVQFPESSVHDYKRSGSDIDNKLFTYAVVSGGAMGLAATGKNAAYDLLSTMAPSADVLALANVEIDLSKIEKGSSVTVKWRGKPLFIRHRTEAEIESARSVPMEELKDPQRDEDRAKNADWLVCLGVCTHLGCVPLPNQGDYNGWFCPCHGSHYDTSGRIRKGPAPLNLEVPPYMFSSEDKLLVGVDKL